MQCFKVNHASNFIFRECRNKIAQGEHTSSEWPLEVRDSIMSFYGICPNHLEVNKTYIVDLFHYLSPVVQWLTPVTLSYLKSEQKYFHNDHNELSIMRIVNQFLHWGMCRFDASRGHLKWWLNGPNGLHDTRKLSLSHVTFYYMIH